jgi:Co/Zn/Cd efflux system component
MIHLAKINNRAAMDMHHHDEHQHQHQHQSQPNSIYAIPCINFYFALLNFMAYWIIH